MVQYPKKHFSKSYELRNRIDEWRCVERKKIESKVVDFLTWFLGPPSLHRVISNVRMDKDTRLFIYRQRISRYTITSGSPSGSRTWAVEEYWVITTSLWIHFLTSPVWWRTRKRGFISPVGKLVILKLISHTEQSKVVQTRMNSNRYEFKTWVGEDATESATNSSLVCRQKHSLNPNLGPCDQ